MKALTLPSHFEPLNFTFAWSFVVSVPLSHVHGALGFMCHGLFALIVMAPPEHVYVRRSASDAARVTEGQRITNKSEDPSNLAYRIVPPSIILRRQYPGQRRCSRHCHRLRQTREDHRAGSSASPAPW